MSFPALRVAPHPEYSAEVIVLITTLGVNRREYLDSKRIRDHLKVFGAHHKVIDMNRDSAVDFIFLGQRRESATVERTDRHVEVIRNLHKSRRIHLAEDGSPAVPQVFVDGCNIGDASSLQDLDDRGVLSAIMRREICPSCLAKRSRTTLPYHCRKCNIEMKEFMPGYQTIEEAMEAIESAERYTRSTRSEASDLYEPEAEALPDVRDCTRCQQQVTSPSIPNTQVYK